MLQNKIKVLVFGVLMISLFGFSQIVTDGGMLWPSYDENIPTRTECPGCSCVTYCYTVCLAWGVDIVCYGAVVGACHAACYGAGMIPKVGPIVGGICAIANALGGCEQAAEYLCRYCVLTVRVCYTVCGPALPMQEVIPID